MKPQIAICSSSDISPERRAELENWFSKEFGHITYRWATPDWYVLALMDSVLADRLGIVERVVRVGESSILVGGISGIITHPEWRGRGIASAVLNRAEQFIECALHTEFTLLLCRPEVAPV